MSLTAGAGPFSQRPQGEFNTPIEPPGALLFFGPVPYRVRAIVGKQTIADSTRMMLLHETGHLPVYYFPEDDLRHDLLEPSEKHTHCPFKGDATYRHIVLDGRTVHDAVWAYGDPIASARFLAGYAAFVWSAVDEWFAEDEQLHGHPRDPFHRIDVHRTTRRVRVTLDGCVLAESRRAKLLTETGLPPRWYVPAGDLHVELIGSDTRTRCAYKGSASYFHVDVDGERHEDLVWTYPCPQHDAEPVRDLYCFWNERVCVEVE